ncbi:hypothetical protein AAC387_Pa02g3327 [Persea americana]
MLKCNLLTHEKAMPHQSATLRRSPRFLSHENALKIDYSKTPNSTKKEVRALLQSPFTPTDSTESISSTKPKRTRKPVKLINGSTKTPGSNTVVLRRSQRLSNLQSTPANADVKTRSEDSVSSDFSMKWGSLEVTQKGEGQNGRRVSLRLMGLAKGVKDSSENLRGLSSSEVARKRGHRKEASSVKILDYSCGALTQKGDSQEQRRRSRRLMSSGSSGENALGSLVPAEAIQKRDCRKGQRNSHIMGVPGEELKASSDFLEKHGSVKSSEKGNCRKKRRMSVRFTDSANGVEKSEMGMIRDDELGREVEREVKKGNSVNCTPVAMSMEGRNGRSKLESGFTKAVEKESSLSMEGCKLQGWTKDQESALRRAYFAARPSPHFWKKVSKMVPGKSAQECFDKIHSNIETPSPQPRLRRNKMNWSPLGQFKLSGGKLLEPFDFNGKKLRNSRLKNPIAQKTVRHLLQKQLIVDQGYEADLFAVLENTTDLPSQSLPQTKMPVTPDCALKPHCHERSSLTVKRTTSKFGTASHMDLTSPPVLKQVKNMAMHEKYIDQLHTREARRKKTSSACNTNHVTADNFAQEISVKEMNVKSARAALVSDAKDAIRQFQHIQSIGICDYQDSGDDEDDDECG